MPLTVFNYNLINKRENKGLIKSPFTLCSYQQAARGKGSRAGLGGLGGTFEPGLGGPCTRLSRPRLSTSPPAPRGRRLKASSCGRYWSPLWELTGGTPGAGRGPAPRPPRLSAHWRACGDRQASSFLHLYPQCVPGFPGRQLLPPAEAPPSPRPHLPDSSELPRVRDTFLGSLQCSRCSWRRPWGWGHREQGTIHTMRGLEFPANTDLKTISCHI